MPFHRIRLRASWTSRPLGDADAAPERLDLPRERLDEASGPLRLSRAFGMPPIDPGRESLVLALDDVPGLRRVRLNGEPLADLAEGADACRLALPADRLKPRNVLELDVDPPGAGAGRPWGWVELVIGPSLADAADDHYNRIDVDRDRASFTDGPPHDGP